MHFSHGKLTTAPADREALAAILTRAATLMDDLENCRLYLVNRDADDPALLWVTELWTSKEAHAASLERADVRALIAEARPLLTAPPEQVRLEPVAGKGLS